MGADIFWVLGYMAAGLALAVLLFLHDSLLLGLTNRFAGRTAKYCHRVGTHLPRVHP